MAMKVRLKRTGKKKQSFYRIVVADSSSPRDGKMIEQLGLYNPNLDPPEVKVNKERLQYWIEEGAIISPTVESILKSRVLLTTDKPPKNKRGKISATSKAK
ncbi:MAG TPA: 30S ribosomal protein S16 [Candidatus Omnitrophica bacterium]|nr:30S ribosomal protein S16 [Candidatus Omnitrophota bacterium]